MGHSVVINIAAYQTSLKNWVLCETAYIIRENQFMKKSMRFGTLVNLADMKEKKAIESMVEVRTLIDIEEQKLKQLVAFRDQYSDSTQRSEQIGISISRMLETRTFMDKISKAIQEQESLVSSVETQLLAKNAEWTKVRYHRLGLEKVLQKELQNQARLQDKRDQAEIDDRSARNVDATNGMKSA